MRAVAIKRKISLAAVTGCSDGCDGGRLNPISSALLFPASSISCISDF